MLQDSLTNSAKTVKSAVEGQAGVLVAGSTLVSPGGKRSNDSKDSNALGAAESPPTEQLRFRGLEPSKRYIISLCTESNSGTLSQVTVAVAEAHAEAPLVRPVGHSTRKQLHIVVVHRSLQGDLGEKEGRGTSSLLCLYLRRKHNVLESRRLPTSLSC